MRQATATPMAEPVARAVPDGMVLVASPRLPVSGVGPDDLREGVRRIGAVVAEQVALYGTLTGVPAAGAHEPAPAGRETGELADVLHLPRRRASGGDASGSGEPG